jgi:hypothetical protein
MARFGSKGRAGRNTAKPTLLQVYRTRIVAGFGCQGKPDNARKWRLFNNIEAFRWRIGRYSRNPQSLTTHPVLPEAIAVLVERGRAMIATRPTRRFDTAPANSDAKPVALV